MTAAGASPRVLVTGAGGFVGRALAGGLRDEGLEVVAADRRGAPLALDVLDREATLAAALAHRPAVVVHGAALTSGDPLEVVDANVRGTLNALEAARAVGASHFVLLGSAGVYAPGAPEPIAEDGPVTRSGAYARSKLLAEDACRAAKSAAATAWLLRLAAV